MKFFTIFFKKSFQFFCVLMLLTLSSCLTLDDVVGAIGGNSGSSLAFTNSEAVSALKEALNIGAKDASSKLSVTDAYFKNAAIKILLPPEADNLLSALNSIPGGQAKVDDVVLRINRSAESAAAEVVPIFKDAVTSMTISDGISIVKGSNTSATEYLKSKTYTQLVSLYQPKVSASLDKPLVMNVSASKAWSTLVSAYNKVGVTANKVARLAGKTEPMPAINVNLSEYVTEKALDGLFLQISKEEQSIRANPVKYASDIITKVFGSLL